jgi:hypothetical protein
MRVRNFARLKNSFDGAVCWFTQHERGKRRREQTEVHGGFRLPCERRVVCCVTSGCDLTVCWITSGCHLTAENAEDIGARRRTKAYLATQIACMLPSAFHLGAVPEATPKTQWERKPMRVCCVMCVV